MFPFERMKKTAHVQVPGQVAVWFAYSISSYASVICVSPFSVFPRCNRLDAQFSGEVTVTRTVTVTSVRPLYLANTGALSFDRPYIYALSDELPDFEPIAAFVHVNVIPMDVERVLLDQTVIVRDGVIETIGSSADGEVPPGALVIDGTGKFLLRTAVKLLPWELAHLAAFALSVDLNTFRVSQYIGIGLSNGLSRVYIAVAALTGGQRSVHDWIAGTAVARKSP